MNQALLCHSLSYKRQLTSFFNLLGLFTPCTRLWDLAAGKTMTTLTHHKKSVRALAIHPTEYSFASGSAGGNNIKKWKCPEGTFVFNFSGHDAIINTMSVNAEGVFFSAGEFSFYFIGCWLISYSFLLCYLCYLCFWIGNHTLTCIDLLHDE